MGVPAFFRWLSKKYPSIVAHCVEEKPKEVGDTKIPVDTSLPNPNDYEFDNLYLDMNGIIHPCSHPENKPAPKNEAEMMVNIFEYIDRIFSIVRPRKLLYMAIDGVAPRAKMNQQRSRRFRAAKESRESREIIFNIKKDLKEKGALLPPEQDKTHFDSNCITPGTEFMDRLSVCLRYYISDRLTNDPGWKNIKIVLSDANVPGEGEHKIMDFIRRQRAQPDHDPNTKHCLNGADADLIMLGLATHELHFTILREEFKPGQKRPCEICAQVGHDKTECEGLPKDQPKDDVEPFVGQDVEFIFIRLHVLREYLERELKMEGLPFYNFERALDDWVFMCFFVGNDFLPHLPSLEIREGAIDRLVKIYKNCLPQMGGYLAESGIVNLKRVQRILKELGEVEDEIFRKRQQFEENMKRRRQQTDDRNKRQRMEESPGWNPRDYGTPLGKGSSPYNNSPSYKQFYENQRTPNRTPNNKTAAADLRSFLMTPETENSSRMSTSDISETTNENRGTKRAFEIDPSKQETKKEPEEPEDNIRLYEEGWKERYYLHKFAVCKELDHGYFERFRKHVANEYVLGLCWVLRYYYQGCVSWKWFYPFHYAPFASDFLDIDKMDGTFEKGTGPFKPLEQLMSVFPAASGNFLPPTWRELMSSPESPIIDFYPCDFKIDLNGKRFAWQGVALLPFVDERRLHRTLKDVYDDLTDEEKRRNTNRKTDVMFVRKGTALFDFFSGLHEGGMLSEKQDIVTDFSHGVRGKVFEDDQMVPTDSTHLSPVPGQLDLSSTQAFSVRYEDPQYDEDFIFPAKVLEKATPPDRTLKPGDFPGDRKWTPKLGMGNNSHSSYQVSRGGHRMIRQELGLNRAPSSYMGGAPPPHMGGGPPPQNNWHNNNWGQNQYQPTNSYNTPSRGGRHDGWNQNHSPWGRTPPPDIYNQNARRGGDHHRGFSRQDNQFPQRQQNHNDFQPPSFPNMQQYPSRRY